MSFGWSVTHSVCQLGNHSVSQPARKLGSQAVDVSLNVDVSPCMHLLTTYYLYLCILFIYSYKYMPLYMKHFAPFNQYRY